MERDKETARQGDKETRRQGDKETRGQGDKESGVSQSPSPPVPQSSSLPVSQSPSLYEPQEAPPRFGLIFLHDLDGKSLFDDPTWTDWLARERLACASPLMGDYWWADRICSSFDPVLSPERFIVEHLLPVLLTRWNLRPGGIALLGIGMGGQGALRMGFRYPEKFEVIAAIDAAIDCHEVYGMGSVLDEMYGSKEECRQDTATLHVHPNKQPPHLWLAASPESRWFRGNDRLHEKLLALGVPHTAELNSEYPPAKGTIQKCMTFLTRSLEIQARRLL